MRALHLALALALGTLVGCGGAGGGIHYNLEPAPPLAVPIEPKDPACMFEVLVKGGDGDYDLLGTLKPADFGAGSIDELKTAIRADVCKLGGEVVVAVQSGTGSFIKASVYRRHRGVAPAPAATP